MVKSGNFDVVVVGAGFFGLHCALFCAEKGLRVLVLEKAEPGSGASGGLVGAMSPHLPRVWTTRKQFQFDALVSAQDHWARIERISGLATGYGRVGRWMPLESQGVLEKAMAQQLAAPDSWAGAYEWTVLPVPSFMSPAIATCGAVYETLSARINPRLALASLTAAVRNAGVEVRSGITVTGVEPGRVHTAEDPFTATHIVLAAGNGAQPLHDGLVTGGMGAGVKGQAALLRNPGGLPDHMVFASGIYIVPHGNGMVAVGSTSEREWSDGHATDGLLDDLVTKAVAICPALRDAVTIERWAGVRPRAPKPDPLLGPVPGAKNVWFAGGAYKIGIGISHHVGLMTARMILGEEVDLPENFLAAHHGLRALPARQGAD